MALHGAALAVRFLLELCALAALAWAGKELAGWPLAVVLPLAAAVVWGLVVAPKRALDAPPAVRWLAEALVLGGAAVALVAAGAVTLGVALAVAAAADRALLAATG